MLRRLWILAQRRWTSYRLFQLLNRVQELKDQMTHSLAETEKINVEASRLIARYSELLSQWRDVSS